MEPHGARLLPRHGVVGINGVLQFHGFEGVRRRKNTPVETPEPVVGNALCRKLAFIQCRFC